MSIDLKTAFENLKTLVLQGKAIETFETYYGEDVVMQADETPATMGKAANHQRELDFFSKVVEFQGLNTKKVSYEDDVIFSELFVDYPHTDWDKVTHDQVSLQKWKDGKVVHERFYYGT